MGRHIVVERLAILQYECIPVNQARYAIGSRFDNLGDDGSAVAVPQQYNAAQVMLHDVARNRLRATKCWLF